MKDNSPVTINDTMFVPWHKRLLNLIIDIVVIIAIIFLIGVFAGLLALMGYDGLFVWFTNVDPVSDRLVTLTIMIVYLFTMELFTQRTVGKYITGTMVVMEDGSKPEARAVIIRALCRIIGLETLTFIRKVPRGWHDSASGTYVVDAKKYNRAKELKESFEEIGMPQIQ